MTTSKTGTVKRYMVRMQVEVTLQLDPKVTERGMDKEFRESIQTRGMEPLEVAAHLAYNAVINNCTQTHPKTFKECVRLSSLDGWADMDISLARIESVECCDDVEAAELKE